MPTSQNCLQEVTTQLIEVIETGLRINGVFHLALTGGTLGNELTRALVSGLECSS